MALINCPECNAEISDQAANCPKCGYNLKAPPKRGFFAKLFIKKVHCPTCGHTGKPGRVGMNAGSCLILIILLCCFIIPGIIYLIHLDSKSAQICCAKCKNKNVIKV